MGEVVIPFKPRGWQQEIYDQMLRFSVLVVHRRAGKTVLAVNWLLREACNKPNGVCTYVAPQFAQAKRICWPYLQEFAGVIPGVEFNVSELLCTLPNGCRIYMLGSENPHPIRGLGIDAAVLDEVAQMPRTAWSSVIRPALADKRGKALFIGTPLGRANLFAELANPREPKPGWFNATLKWNQTGAIDDDEIDALRKEMPPEEFEQEMECSFDSSIRGSYLGRVMSQAEDDGRITSVPHDPALPVTTSFDLGVGGGMVVWFSQHIANEVRLIDYEVGGDTWDGIPEMVSMLNAKPYNYERHLFPHDVRVKELGTRKTRQETLEGLGIHPTRVQSIGLMDGINAARLLVPRCWFDREKCFNGIEALKLYRSEYNEVKQVLSDAPFKDWTCHTADSFRMLAVGLKTPLAKDAPLDYSRMNRRAVS